MSFVLGDEAVSGSVRERYSLGRELGKGHFSIVRSGRDRESGKEVAVKIIEKNHVDVDKETLRREVVILKELDHPNIVRLIDVFESPYKVYLVMEYAGGGELFDSIVEDHPDGYSEKDAAAITKALLSAVAYLHSNSIVHRDLKPENVLYPKKKGPVEDVKITDFGLAKIMTHDSILSTACGTPSYVAPDVLSQTDNGYDQAADLWSVGVILYILLCGFPPFYSDDEGTGELFDMIMSGVFEFPEPYWTDISSEAKDLVKRFLLVNPKERITAPEALNHPWIVTRTSHSDKVIPDICTSLKKNMVKNKFRIGVQAIRAALRFRKKI